MYKSINIDYFKVMIKNNVYYTREYSLNIHTYKFMNYTCKIIIDYSMNIECIIR